MKKFALALSIVLFALTGTANAITYDFDSLVAGTYSETSFNDLFDGVSFDNNGGSYQILKVGSNFVVDDIYNEPRQEKARRALYTFEPRKSTVATFDLLTDYVSITNICDSPDMVSFFMRVYDADHTLLSQIEKNYEPVVTQNGFLSLSYTLKFETGMAKIASVEFWSDDCNYTQGDGYWDDFTFNAAPAPEPSTIILLTAGLLGVLGKRKFLKVISN